MALIKVNSLNELVAASNDLLEGASAQNRQTHLVVPSQAWADTRKLQLRSVAPLGVQVDTYDHAIAQLWELFGDGSTLISALDRAVLLRPLVAQVNLLEADPSPRLIAQLSDFVQEAVYPGLSPARPLSESESKIMELVALYEQRLFQEGLVETAQAEYQLLQQGACAGMRFVFEAPDLHSAHVRNFIGGLESCADVSVIEQQLALRKDIPLTQDELVDLRNRLFTGIEGLSAQGRVLVGEARGAHAQADVIVSLVQAIHQESQAPYEGIAVCLPNVADAHPQLLQKLAQEEVPFQAEFAIPVSRTGLGSAFLQAEDALDDKDDDRAFSALVSLASSPYSGIANEDARALQMRWREQAHATFQARLNDVRLGFDQGNVKASEMQERLAPLAQLLDSPREQRVELMFQHAHEARLDANILIDDRQAADTLLDYLDACTRFACAPSFNEYANLPVQLARSYKPEDGPLVITSPRALGLQRYKAVVMCGLDTEHYPMSAPAEPFDALKLNLGINRADTLAKDQRILLLNTIEAAQDHFAFERATHNKQGDESSQSALFEELLAVYRSRIDDDDHVPVAGIPHALLPWSCAISEAEVLSVNAQRQSHQIDVIRGALQDDASLQDLLQRGKDGLIPVSPTALEDYYRCPYRWFTSRRVGYSELDRQFDKAAQGTLAHTILERFYARFLQAGNSRVTPANLPDALSMANEVFDEVVAEERSRQKKGLLVKTQADELTCDDLRQDVLELIKRDATFLPGFEPKYLELELAGADGVPLEYAGLPSRGKVDRIDVDKDGNAVIIDYKLSKLSQGYGLPSSGDTPQRIQTDIYATLVQRYFEAQGIPLKVVGSVYRSYAANIMRGAYAQEVDWGDTENARSKSDALPRPDGDETYQRYLERIEQIVASCVERLKAGDIKPDPISKDACDYCRGRLFCPIGGR